MLAFNKRCRAGRKLATVNKIQTYDEVVLPMARIAFSDRGKLGAVLDSLRHD
jgi:hypothetical protein